MILQLLIFQSHIPLMINFWRSLLEKISISLILQVIPFMNWIWTCCLEMALGLKFPRIWQQDPITQWCGSQNPWLVAHNKNIALRIATNWMIFFHLSFTWLSDFYMTKIAFSVINSSWKTEFRWFWITEPCRYLFEDTFFNQEPLLYCT